MREYYAGHQHKSYVLEGDVIKECITVSERSEQQNRSG